MGAAGYCVMSTTGKTKKGFQRAGGAPYRDLGIDRTELQVSFRIHGGGGLYYA